MRGLSSATLWIIIILVFMLLFINYNSAEKATELTISEWRRHAEQGLIVSAVDEGGKITGSYHPESTAGGEALYETQYLNGQEDSILSIADKNNVEYSTKRRNTMLMQILFTGLLPVLLIVGLWILLMRQLQGGSNKAMSFGKSKARLVKEGEIKVTFKDVAGVEEACEELHEVVEFLKDPKKFTNLGARIPKGVLLVGPPGTGKTLLGRAVAGEAGVPFFSLSGSDFVEMFVGVGASRVRDLFEQAKKASPCIVFIDEIDAVGRHRGSGMGGGHDEREQTLNQLLVEMDGFSENEEVIIFAATNRPDVLDKALLRPGRFDRQVNVGLPDVKGREKILTIHAKKIKVSEDVKFARIARATPGFSGADLANLVNESALLAARRNKKITGNDDFEEARDRVWMGPERRSMVMTARELKNTAYHEAGHAIVAHFTPGCDPVHKITIIPRGRALGVTWTLPDEEMHTKTRQELFARICMAMGGRVAEEIKFKEYTNGAVGDIQMATSLAHEMVCNYGMSDKLGPRSFSTEEGMQFVSRERNYSEESASIIDSEIKRLIDEGYEHARKILTEKEDLLERVSEALLERETLLDEDFLMLVEGKQLPPLEPNEPPSEPPQPPPLEDVLEREERKDPPSIGDAEPQPSS